MRRICSLLNVSLEGIHDIELDQHYRYCVDDVIESQLSDVDMERLHERKNKTDRKIHDTSHSHYRTLAKNDIRIWMSTSRFSSLVVFRFAFVDIFP